MLLLLLLPLGHMQCAELYVPSGVNTSLAGVKVEMPKDLHGPVSVLVLGFSQKSGDEAREWGKAIVGLPGCHGERLTWYQMPVLAGAPAFVRPMILRSMRNGLTPDLRQHFLVVTDKEDEWKRAAGYQEKDQAYVLGVNQEGRILARWHGPVQASQSVFKDQMRRYCGTP